MPAGQHDPSFAGGWPSGQVGAVPPEAFVRGDRVRLAQALGNLLANALEHGAGTVEVAARTLSGRVRIEVSDEGGGLPAPVADLARRPRAGRGRRGRGLAIASEIAARHGVPPTVAFYLETGIGGVPLDGFCTNPNLERHGLLVNADPQALRDFQQETTHYVRLSFGMTPPPRE